MNVNMKGVEINIYQSRGHFGKPGKWHAHVSLPDGWRNYFDGYVDPTGRTVLAARNGGDGYWWIDAAPYVDGEDTARDLACQAIGYVYGRRLLEQIGPKAVPASIFPGMKKLRF